MAAWLYLFIGLARIQLWNHDQYEIRAADQHKLRVDIPCDRGRVLDRNGVLLAGTLSSPSVFANPSQVGDRSAAARNLGGILGVSSWNVKNALAKGGSFVWLSRKVAPAVGAKVRSAGLPGVFCIPEKDRIRPFDDLALQVIGITDVDNQGLEGVEKQFDSYLCGRPGWQVLQRIPARGSCAIPGFPSRPPADGCDVVLTLDAAVQEVVELELCRAVDSADAAWGMAMCMDPATGEILAMTSWSPDDGADGSPTINRCVATQFEPGSTYKLVTYSAALEEGVVDPEDLFDAGPLQMSLGCYTIHDHEPYDTLSVREAFEFSSNIVTAQVAERLGEERLYSYSRDFGFGCRTGIALPGELAGVLRRPCDWSRRSVGTIAIGQEVAVTLVQLVSAYAAVANDGILMEPRIVREIRNADGSVQETFPPAEVRRVVSSETARILRSFLAGVVEKGTGTAADLEVWPTGGKSGTAQTAENGSYANRRFTSSFIGFVPVEEPKLVTAVVLGDLSRIFWGGVVAGPVFREIMMKVACSELSGPFREVLESEAASWVPGEETPPPASEPPAELAAAVMPDVRGLPLREAKSLLLRAGARVGLEGAGAVRCQEPAPGAKIEPGERCRLQGET